MTFQSVNKDKKNETQLFQSTLTDSNERGCSEKWSDIFTHCFGLIRIFQLQISS